MKKSIRRWSGSSSILNLIIFDLYAVVGNFSVKVAHSLIGSFSRCFLSFRHLVYNYCHWTNKNHRSKMGRMSHLSDAYDAFSSSCASFSLLSNMMTMTPTNHMTTVQGPGSLLVRAFCYVLNYPLIKSFDFRLVELFLVESQYSQYFGLTFPAQILL